MGRREPAGDRRNRVAHVGSARHLGTGSGRERVAGHALLEQQFGRLDGRFGVEALDHRSVVDDVAEGHDNHALVMSHVTVDDGDRRPSRKATCGVVERFAKAIPSGGAAGGQSGEVADRGVGSDHRCEGGGVGGDHEGVAQAPSDAQAGHAEPGILVSLSEVTGVESRLGDSPRHAVLVGVTDLAVDDQPIGVLQHAADGGSHHEGRHQVLEHRPGPRDQGGATADGSQRATEAEPVFGIDVALGDRHEAGETGFRGEQVVVARIQRSVADAETDREQLADWIEQEVELHLPGESLGKVGGRLEPSNECGRRRWSLAGDARRRIGCFGECRELGPVPRRLEE